VAAGDPTRFSAATLEAFFAAVLINDVVDAELVPPDAVPLLHTPERLADYVGLCRQQWAEGLDRSRLIQVADAAMMGRPVDPPTLTAFKHVRAKFKQLRYAHALCDRRLRGSRLLNRVTATMGQLQDACRHGQHGQARLRGAQLRLLTTRPSLAWLAREVAGFRMIGPEAFAMGLDRDLDRLARLSVGGAIAGADFHAARKVVSRHNSFWTAMTVLHPHPAHHRLFRWMSAINGAMGRWHDGLVERRVAHPASYRDSFALPADIADRLYLLGSLPRPTTVAQ